MKKIVFALLVFGIPALFPIYLVVELTRSGGTKSHTVVEKTLPQPDLTHTSNSRHKDFTN
ncbi:MAG: hypothetical protein EOO00_04135 [Chitinophagaceae bacterium]|nr:MAG: hypothetical protein EOO00_04135 [Chitinophagaceae bacterium]